MELGGCAYDTVDATATGAGGNFTGTLRETAIMANKADCASAAADTVDAIPDSLFAVG